MAPDNPMDVNIEGKALFDFEGQGSEELSFKVSIKHATFNKDLNELLSAKDLNKLSKEQTDDLEGLLMYEELSNALRCIMYNKSPGSDGFSIEFLKMLLAIHRILCFKIPQLSFY